MLRLIPRGGKITVDEICTKLAAAGHPTSVRTIQRDLVKLSADGPFHGSLQCDGAKPGGWYWSERAGLFELPTLNEATAMTFSLAERFLKDVIPPEMLAELLPYFRRAEQTLRAIGKKGLPQLPARMQMIPRTQRLLRPSLAPGILDTVYQALINGKQIMASYRGRNGIVKSMDLNPVGLLFRDAVVSLVCCKPSGTYAEFMLHRFQGAVLGSTSNQAPKGASIDAYLQRGAQDFLLGEGKEIRFRALFDPQAAHNLIEAHLSADQSVDEQRADGRVLIQATVIDTLTFRKWLLGYGASVEVLGPPTLRKWVIDTTLAMRQRYGQT